MVGVVCVFRKEEDGRHDKGGMVHGETSHGDWSWRSFRPRCRRKQVGFVYRMGRVIVSGVTLDLCIIDLIVTLTVSRCSLNMVVSNLIFRLFLGRTLVLCNLRTHTDFFHVFDFYWGLSLISYF